MQKNPVAKPKSPYFLFQAKLYPVLPYLIYKANQVKKTYPTPPAMSNHLNLGSSDEKYLIIGESTAAGVGAKDTTGTIAHRIFESFGKKVEVINFGKNGIRVKEVIPTFRHQLEAIEDPMEGVFIYMGANDCFKLTSPNEYERSLLRLLDQVKTQFNPNWIYLADIPPVQIFPAFPSILKSYLKDQRSFLRSQMKKIAQQDDSIVFEEIELDLDKSFFSEDLIHPSSFGYSAIADFSIAGLKRANKI